MAFLALMLPGSREQMTGPRSFASVAPHWMGTGLMPCWSGYAASMMYQRDDHEGSRMGVGGWTASQHVINRMCDLPSLRLRNSQGPHEHTRTAFPRPRWESNERNRELTGQVHTPRVKQLLALLVGSTDTRMRRKHDTLAEAERAGRSGKVIVASSGRRAGNGDAGGYECWRSSRRGGEGIDLGGDVQSGACTSVYRRIETHIPWLAWSDWISREHSAARGSEPGRHQRRTWWSGGM